MGHGRTTKSEDYAFRCLLAVRHRTGREAAEDFGAALSISDIFNGNLLA
jgi:hypothetical protein